MAEQCPGCGKFAASWARNPRQSDWDTMNNGPEYICIRCAARRPTEGTTR